MTFPQFVQFFTSGACCRDVLSGTFLMIAQDMLSPTAALDSETRCRPGRAVTESVAPQLSWSAKEEDENEAAVGISPDRCGGRFGVERIPSAGFALRSGCIPCKLLCLGSMLSAGGPL